VLETPQPPTPDQPATETCGATTTGLFGRLLGPCLNQPRHPDGTLHRDAHGSEWLEYDHTEDAAFAPSWEQQDDGTWWLSVGDGYILVADAGSTPEDRAERAACYWAKHIKNQAARSAPCTDCITGTHSVNTHRRHLPPPRIVPVEYCGHLSPQTLLTTSPTECVLRPGHSGSHADDRGCRWWPTPEAIDWQQRAEQAEDLLRIAHDTSNKSEAERARAVEHRDQLAAALREVLSHFVHKGHPGEPCLQTGWISEKTVARWRAIAYPPQQPEGSNSDKV
jgi:hypothetical protein